MRSIRLNLTTILGAGTDQAEPSMETFKQTRPDFGFTGWARIIGAVLLLLLAIASFGLVIAVAVLHGNSFAQTNLVADNESFHPQIVDPHLIDAWGIALRPPGAGGHIWIDNAMSGTSVEYIGDVNGQPLHQDGLKSVTLDLPRWTDHGFAFVTGLAYNSAADIKGQPLEFPVSGPANNNTNTPPTPIPGGTSGSAAFAFVTEDGCINGWRANTKVAMTSAPIMADYSKTSAHLPYRANCVFSGAALTNNAYDTDAFTKSGGNHLFATDFRNNMIQVFDNRWKDVTSSFHFQTPTSIGELHVFNISDLGGHLYVAYAKFSTNSDEGMEEEDGLGKGFGHIVEYNEDGTLVKDFDDEGMLNAPWGLAIAPAKFGRFGGDLLVADLGDGSVAAFDHNTGKFIDQLRDEWGNPVNIDRIWGLTFGNGVTLGDANSLYFTAGPNNEYDGLFGKLTVSPRPMAIFVLAGILFLAAAWALWRTRERSPLSA
jgi:uncharacterized protein (TIGR03118 family)